MYLFLYGLSLVKGKVTNKLVTLSFIKSELNTMRWKKGRHFPLRSTKSMGVKKRVGSGRQGSFSSMVVSQPHH
jgi:hypothetical protein